MGTDFHDTGSVAWVGWGVGVGEGLHFQKQIVVKVKQSKPKKSK